MIICNKYEILYKIGEGSFGKIYKGKNIRTLEDVAIKIEPNINGTKLLKNETKIYQYLSRGEGIPQIKWFGVDETNSYMVVNLLGISLLDLKEKYNTFSLKVVFQIGIQILERLKFIHNMGLIHRDIKPDNFLLGKDNKIFIIDFGLCKKYCNDKKEHIEFKKINKIIGTPSFVSLNIYNLDEPSRRDDLESMVYILLFLYLKKDDEKNLVNCKKDYLNNELVPVKIKEMLLYIRKLEFKENPNYNYLFYLLEN